MISRRKILQLLATSAAASATFSAAADDHAPTLESGLLGAVIPSSGEKITRIGIGTNRYGVGEDVAARQPLREVLAKYAELGGGVIDTAPMYRSSETVLGKLIRELELGEQFFMATKCDVAGGDATRAQLRSSEQKLQSGQLDLVAVHNLTNWREQLPVLQEAKQAGQIRYVGITTSRARQYEEFEAVMKSEELDFVQLNYSLADRGAEQRLLSLAADRGQAVMCNLPFARGKLFAAVKDQEMPEWASELGAASWAQLFLKYVVSHPSVTCAIPGTTKLHHLIDNMGAARGALPDSSQRQQVENWFASL